MLAAQNNGHKGKRKTKERYLVMVFIMSLAPLFLWPQRLNVTHVSIACEKLALRRNICDVRGVLATEKEQINENGFQQLTRKYNDLAEMKEFGPNDIAFMIEIII